MARAGGRQRLSRNRPRLQVVPGGREPGVPHRLDRPPDSRRLRRAGLPERPSRPALRGRPLPGRPGPARPLAAQLPGPQPHRTLQPRAPGHTLRVEDFKTQAKATIAVIGGERLMIGGGADGFIYALKARTVELVWKCHFSTKSLNSPVPVVGDTGYASQSEEPLEGNFTGQV